MYRMNVMCFLMTVLIISSCFAETVIPPVATPSQAHHQLTPQPLYPNEFEKQPSISSPYLAEEGTEIVTAVLKNGKYVCIPVTVENGKPLHYSYRVPWVYGKDHQLHINKGDFPTLAKTGLHSENELDGKTMITGVPVDVITYIGRPRRFSGEGFMADDENIISVLKGDNNLVRKLGLTHPQMAKPLFHVWNMMLEEIEHGRLRRFSDIQCFFYNGNKISMKAEGMKGWQISIFQDEIQGRFDIDIQWSLTNEEKSFLRSKYSHLSGAQMAKMEEKLTRFHFSEMVPYYIMRYGFYEGHTGYRADPIAVARIFGLKSLEEIEEAFQGSLYNNLFKHYTDFSYNDIVLH